MARCSAKLAGPIAVRRTPRLAGRVTVCLACKQRFTTFGVFTTPSTKLLSVAAGQAAAWRRVARPLFYCVLCQRIGTHGSASTEHRMFFDVPGLLHGGHDTWGCSQRRSTCVSEAIPCSPSLA